MDKRRGKFQRAILEKLESYSHLPILQNRLMWDIAIEKDEVIKRGISYGIDKHIEEGIRKKSFEIKFRESIKKLSEDGQLIISPRKVCELDEILDLLPYLTDRLEIHIVRKLLLPTIKKYITDRKPAISYRDFDPFGFQIDKLKTSDNGEYRILVRKWKEIEVEIVRILQDTESPLFDSWVCVLMWGRFYFGTSKSKHLLNLPDADKPEENEIIVEIEKLSGMVKSGLEYKIGYAKKVLYALFSAPRFGNTTLSHELKRYLFKEREELLRSLPGDEDTNLFRRQEFGIRVEEYNYKHRKFSPLLDKLFTRHIFRELSFVKIP